MSINESVLEEKIDEIDGTLEEIKALNNVISEFIEDVRNLDIENASEKLLKDRAYRIVFFSNMIHDKASEISQCINKLRPCQ